MRGGVNGTAFNLAYRAPVTVARYLLNLGSFLKTQLGERLLRSVTECLAQFRRVDLGQPHLDLLLAYQHGQRIAVRHGHDQSRGVCSVGRDSQCKSNRKEAAEQ